MPCVNCVAILESLTSCFIIKVPFTLYISIASTFSERIIELSMYVIKISFLTLFIDVSSLVASVMWFADKGKMVKPSESQASSNTPIILFFSSSHFFFMKVFYF